MFKKWKQFSDEVDKYNRKLLAEYNEECDKNMEEYRSKPDMQRNLIQPIKPIIFEKTIVNYLEWECGKLDL